MKKSLSLRLFAAVGGVLIALGAGLTAQNSQVLGFEALTLTLTVPDRQFLVLEPIPVAMRLENRTGRNVVGHSVLEFASGRTTIMIQPEGGSAYRVEQLSVLSELVGVHPRVIRPGEAREITELLDVGLHEILPQPGRYRVQAFVAGIDPGDIVRSNVVTITLREPDAIEQAAQDYIRSTDSARYLFTGLAKDPLYTHLQEVATLFGDTVFGDYASLRLGEIDAARGNDASARAYLLKVSKKRGFPLASRALQTLEKLQR